VSHFQDFEKCAVRLLAGTTLGPELLERVLEEAELVSYEYSGVGYFLTVRHPRLPKDRRVLSEPVVIGRVGEIEGGFLVFVQNAELMLECYTAGAVKVPSNFREQNVNVAAA